MMKTIYCRFATVAGRNVFYVHTVKHQAKLGPIRTAYKTAYEVGLCDQMRFFEVAHCRNPDICL